MSRVGLQDAFFKSEGHKERFQEAMQQNGKIYDGLYDPEYSAALYILTSDASTWNKAQEYVEFTGIDFPTMREEIDFSGGYSVLILLASNLFNGQMHIDPLEFLRLDDTNFEVAMTAIRLRRD